MAKLPASLAARGSHVTDAALPIISLTRLPKRVLQKNSTFFSSSSLHEETVLEMEWLSVSEYDKSEV